MESPGNKDDNTEEAAEEIHIHWKDIIFLPFHMVFKTIVLISIIIKTMLGPVQSVYSIVYCSDVMDRNVYLYIIKLLYWYFTDAIYVLDTFLHIAHSFMFYWMIFRVLSAIVSILCAALQGGSGVIIRRPLVIIGAVCDCIAVIDILLKLFVTYYNENGIIVFDKRKCVLNYLSRGFLMDVIGILPWPRILELITTIEISESTELVINATAKFAHLYIVMCFFNHIADSPSIYNIYLLVFFACCLLIDSYDILSITFVFISVYHTTHKTSHADYKI